MSSQWTQNSSNPRRLRKVCRRAAERIPHQEPFALALFTGPAFGMRAGASAMRPVLEKRRSLARNHLYASSTCYR